MRYDRLGVNDVVEQIESDYDRKLLPEPSQLLAFSIRSPLMSISSISPAKRRARSPAASAPIIRNILEIAGFF